MGLANLDRCAFDPELSPVEGNVWRSLHELSRRINLAGALARTPNVKVWVVPSLYAHVHENKSYGTRAGVSKASQAEILDAMGLPPDTKVKPIFHGGSSIAGALPEAAKLVHADPSTTIVLAGAEDLASLEASHVVTAAKDYICPSDLYGKTLDPEVEMTLITAYSLVESSVLPDKLIEAHRDRINAWRETGGIPLTDRIHSDEVAGRNKGAFLATVNGLGDQSKNPIFIAGGGSQLADPSSWYNMPAGLNLALDPLAHIKELLAKMDLEMIENGGAVSPALEVELYECFFVAKVQQVAALLGLEKIDDSNIGRILDFFEKYKPITTLQDWAAWCIASVRKLDGIVESLRRPGGEKKHAVLVGNGGVMTSISAALLTVVREFAEKVDWSSTGNILPPAIDHRVLVQNPAVLEGQSGTIDMITHQEPIRSKGAITQDGTTFVRVLLEDGNYVLTNLIGGEGAIGDKVKLEKSADSVIGAYVLT